MTMLEYILISFCCLFVWVLLGSFSLNLKLMMADMDKSDGYFFRKLFVPILLGPITFLMLIAQVMSED